MYGPYFPCNMNRKAYEAAWDTLYKLANTPTIPAGGGWVWVSPLSRLHGCESYFNPEMLGCYAGEWSLLSATLSAVDAAVVGGHAPSRATAPWSVCGQAATDYFFFSDGLSAANRDYLLNCPVMTPIESFRSEFGATSQWPL